jgi:hypothetical protein
MAILNLPRLRAGLRAELGAFFPLLVLRYLEQQASAAPAAGRAAAAGGGSASGQQAQQPPDATNVLAALSALHGLLADPQLLVDLYVNYDCDLQAANLYECTVEVRASVARGPCSGCAAVLPASRRRCHMHRPNLAHCVSPLPVAVQCAGAEPADAPQRGCWEHC